MMILLKKATTFYTVIVLICSVNFSFISSDTNLSAVFSSVGIEKRKEKIVKRKAKKRFRKKLKALYQEGNLAVLVLGGIMSLMAAVFLFMGGGAASVLFGFFGGLLCFIAWDKEDGDLLPLIGVVLGAVAVVIGLRQFFSTRD